MKNPDTMDADPAFVSFPDSSPKEVLMKDPNTMDPAFVSFPDSSPKKVLLMKDSNTIDPAFVSFPDSSPKKVLGKDSDTMETGFVSFPDSSSKEVLMKDPDTMDPADVRAPDPNAKEIDMKDPDTMDPAFVSFPDSSSKEVLMKDPNTMDTAQVRVVPVTSFLEFPGELLLRILKFLNPADITKLGETSRDFNKISKDPELWKRLVIDVAQINNHYQALQAVVKRATKLKYIKITDENGITFDEGSFVNGMAPDRSLGNFDEQGMATLIEMAKATLKVLTVGNDDEDKNDAAVGENELDIELDNETIVKFGCLTQLETFEVCGNGIESSGIKGITKLKNLKVLKIPGWCCQIQTKKMDFNYLFGELKNLRVVDLSHHRVTNESLSILAKNNPNLEVLELYGCEGLKKSEFDVGSSMPNIRRLSLKTTGVTNKGLLNMIKNCSQLEHLDLKFCRNLKKGFLDIIKTNCPNLENLGLGYLTMGNPDILKRRDLSVFTTHFKKLKALDLTDCSHADEEFVQAMVNRGIQTELNSDML